MSPQLTETETLECFSFLLLTATSLSNEPTHYTTYTKQSSPTHAWHQTKKKVRMTYWTNTSRFWPRQQEKPRWHELHIYPDMTIHPAQSQTITMNNLALNDALKSTQIAGGTWWISCLVVNFTAFQNDFTSNWNETRKMWSSNVYNCVMLVFVRTDYEYSAWDHTRH